MKREINVITYRVGFGSTTFVARRIKIVIKFPKITI